MNLLQYLQTYILHNSLDKITYVQLLQTIETEVELWKMLIIKCFQLTFLEDPDVGETAVSFMLSDSEKEKLAMTCRGSNSCCGTETNRLCDEGIAMYSYQFQTGKLKKNKLN